MSDGRDHRLIALGALDLYGTPARVLKGLTTRGTDSVVQHLAAMSDGHRRRLEGQADDLTLRGVDVLLTTDPAYPRRLAQAKPTPSMLFLWGANELLSLPGVGMCGSRNATVSGLRAARACGEEVARRGFTIVSGYAKGVDTETHLAALTSGGRTIIVLAEGISLFRHKTAFQTTGLPPDRVLVVSQFPPTQAWTAGAAMTRNSVIAGLSKALVVIEASEKGGTIDAGLRALEMGRPVLALEFSSSETPVGNRLLFEKGARPIRTQQELGRILDEIGPPTERPIQTSFLE